MAQGLTPSEKFVNELCERSFLKPWTHPNPIGKKGKELCDCLVVCGNDIIIISVKDIEYKNSGDLTGYNRWKKHAIEKSALQIWGAERWLNNSETVIRHDGRTVSLPKKSQRRYHRISVSLGSKKEVPIIWGELGHGFVHVCDELSVNVLFQALDTIIDFVDFLQKVEKSDSLLFFDGGGVEDLVALYIQNGYTLDMQNKQGKPDLLIISNDIWESLSKSEEYKNMLIDFKTSYMWDKLIESYLNDFITNGMFDMLSKKVSKNELAIVTMALQPRRYRANLADAFIEFLKKSNIASRIVNGYNNTLFVFLIGKSSDREFRSKELFLRCSIVSNKFPDKTIIGIARDPLYEPSKVGYSSDIVYMKDLKWSQKEKEELKRLQKELGYFSNL